MKLNSSLLKEYFYKSANKDGKITEKEIRLINDQFQREEVAGVFETQQFSIEKNSFDSNKNSMSLSEYMLAMNRLHKQIVYSDREINLSNKQYILSHLDQFKDADPLLKRDEEFVISIVKQRSDTLLYADELLKQDPEFIIRLLKERSIAFKYIEPKFKEDPEFILKAVSQNGLVLDCVDDKFKENPAIVLAAVKEHPGSFDCIPPSLHTEIFLSKILEKNSSVMHIDSFRKIFDKTPMNSPLRKTYKEITLPIISELNYLGITKLDRFKNNKIIQEIIHNRSHSKANDPRPVALIIYPKTDRRGSFGNNQIEKLIERGYKVVYQEANNEKDFYRAIKNEKQGSVALLIIGGHGDQGSTAFGGQDPTEGAQRKSEELELDLSDEKEMRILKLKKYLKPNAHIILESCSTGKGREKQKNMANMLGRVFSTQTIFAPTDSTLVTSYAFDKNNVVTGVSFHKVPTYKIGPRK
jgi:hypothetical protein